MIIYPREPPFTNLIKHPIIPILLFSFVCFLFLSLFVTENFSSLIPNVSKNTAGNRAGNRMVS